MRKEKLHIACGLLLTVGLLAACSTDDDVTDNGGGATEIRLNADCWQVMKGTRAATFDNAQQLEDETGGFMCCVYDYGTTTPYFDAVSVRYDNEEDAGLQPVHSISSPICLPPYQAISPTSLTWQDR